MNIWFHKGQLDYFRRKAKHSNLEQYALLIGKHRTKSDLEIHYLAYPELDIQTNDSVSPDDDSVEEIQAQAKKSGLYDFGTIHSHPNPASHPFMSPADHKSAKDYGDKVSGIVEMISGKTRVVFWQLNSSLPCKIKYLS